MGQLCGSGRIGSLVGVRRARVAVLAIVAAIVGAGVVVGLAACGKVADVPLYVVLPEADVPGVTPVFQDVHSLRLSVRGGTPGGSDMVVFGEHVQDFVPGKTQVISLHGLTGGHSRYVVLEGLEETADEYEAGQGPTILARGVSAPGDYLAPGQSEPTGKKYPSVTIFLGRIGEFAPVRATLSDARAFFTTADLGKGRFAFAGGVGWDDATGRAVALPSVEIFDENGFAFERATADLAAPRAFAASAPIAAGGELIAGGVSNPAAGASAVDQAEFLGADGTPTGQTPKAIARTFAAASVFQKDGGPHVLFAGGSSTFDVMQPDSALQELVGDHFVSDLGSLQAKRACFTATELADGRVLFAGGYARVPVFGGNEIVGVTETAELLDTSSPLAHSDAPPMTTKRWAHTATLLDDGTVLMVGGSSVDPDPVTGLAPANGSTDLFLPEQFTFKFAWPPLPSTTARAHHAATKMTDGDVLVTGGSTFAGAFVAGSNGGLAIGCSSVYQARAGRFLDAGSLIIPRYGHASVSLPGGQVLVVGGYGPDGRPQNTAEVYTPCWSDDECTAAGHPPAAPPASCP